MKGIDSANRTKKRLYKLVEWAESQIAWSERISGYYGVVFGLIFRPIVESSVDFLDNVSRKEPKKIFMFDAFKHHRCIFDRFVESTAAELLRQKIQKPRLFSALIIYYNFMINALDWQRTAMLMSQRLIDRLFIQILNR